MDEKIDPVLAGLTPVDFATGVGHWREPFKGQRLSLTEAMAIAIKISQHGAPFVSPNPCVGCVVLSSDNEFLAYGFHPRVGERHAEIDALQKLSPDEIKGSHFFVTLEPCAHQGRTPSCAKTLASLPIAQVTFGLIDPFEKVAGQGLEILRNAGIDVMTFHDRMSASQTSLSPQQALAWQMDLESTCEIFLKNVRQKKPFVSVKAAISLDGAMALKSGESQWITGPEAREHGHQLRAKYDLTAIGVNTLLQDDPRLNVRLPNIQKQNAILILDPQGRGLQSDREFKIFSAHSPKHIFWAVRTSQLSKNSFSELDFQDLDGAAQKEFQQRHRASLLPLAEETAPLNWSALLAQLWQWNVKSLLVEGGPHTIGSLLTQRAVDRLHLFQAPILVGGGHQTWSGEFAISQMKDRLELKGLRRQTLGTDLYLTGLL